MKEPKSHIDVFIAYSRKDTEYLNELRKHLILLQRNKTIKIWYDGEIVPGTVWEKDIKKHLHNADIVLLLISADSLNSEYFYEKEMADALERHHREETIVVPVILRDCTWELSNLKDLQALPKDGKPIKSWTDHSSAYANIVRGLYKSIDEVKRRRQELAKAQALEKQKHLAEKERQRQIAEQEKLAAAKQKRLLALEKTNAEKAKQERAKLEKEKAELLEAKRQKRLQAEEADWAKLQKSESIADHKTFLKKHPHSKHAEEASQRLSTLKTAKNEQQKAWIKKNGRWIGLLLLLPFVSWGVLEFVNAPDNPILETGTFTDSRDGQTYKWVRLNDGNEWMAENLNYKTDDSWCYDDKDSSCKKYGRLYTWEAAKKACPSGWRLPSDEEWKKLVNVFGGYYDNTAEKMIGDPKDSYKALVKDGSSRFNALLGGWRDSGDSLKYHGQGNDGYYWSKTQNDANSAWQILLGNETIERTYNLKPDGFSCRCIKDDLSQPTEIDTSRQLPKKEEFEEKDQKAWIATSDTGSIESFKNYQLNFPNGQYHQQAQKEIESIERAQQIIIAAGNDERAWESATKENTISAYKAYQQKYSKGKYFKEAGRLIEKLDWENVQKIDKIDSYRNHQQKYPNGTYYYEAQKKIKYLEEEDAWKEAKRINSKRAYEAYKSNYPKGKYITDALKNIKDLTTYIIRGTVKNWAGEPLSAVTIVLKGTTYGTITTKEGKFSLTSSNKDDVLIVYYAGFETKEVAVNGRSELEITLNASGLHVKGTVKERNGDPVSYANILIKGTAKGSSVNEEGKFLLNLSTGKEVLLVSALGFKMKEIPVDGRSELDITLELDMTMLADFVTLAGEKYRVDKFNGKTWLAENLNYDVGEGSWCYDNKSNNCEKYGRLYNWEAAKKACKKLGVDWRLPNDEEWQSLAKDYGGYFDAYSQKKIGDPTEAYKNLIFNSSFSARLSGYRRSNGSFKDLDARGYYWSGDHMGSGRPFYYRFNKKLNELERIYIQNNPNKNGFSCRCIKD